MAKIVFIVQFKLLNVYNNKYIRRKNFIAQNYLECHIISLHKLGIN